MVAFDVGILNPVAHEALVVPEQSLAHASLLVDEEHVARARSSTVVGIAGSGVPPVALVAGRLRVFELREDRPRAELDVRECRDVAAAERDGELEVDEILGGELPVLAEVLHKGPVLARGDHACGDFELRAPRCSSKRCSHMFRREQLTSSTAGAGGDEPQLRPEPRRDRNATEAGERAGDCYCQSGLL
ncbi:hypothetical protein ACFPRL_32025 [Pseudoclavibacter helvolus]